MADIHPTMARVFDYSGLDPSALAGAINHSPQSISNWSNRGISKQGAIDVSKRFNVSVDWVLTGRGLELEEKENTSNPDADGGSKSSIPPIRRGINEAATRVMSWREEVDNPNPSLSRYIPRPFNLSAAGFALEVYGQTMLPEFKPGDLIYVEPAIELAALKDGDFVIMQSPNSLDWSFKQFIVGETQSDCYLKNLNPEWTQPHTQLTDDFILIGKVTGKYVEY